MTEIKALKYYSQGKWRSPDAAQEEVNKLKEKHPDREYTILINLRSQYKYYTVAQVQEVVVDYPDQAEIDAKAGPPPEAPPYSFRAKPVGSWERTVWEDFEEVRLKYKRRVQELTAPARKVLRGKLNP